MERITDEPIELFKMEFEKFLNNPYYYTLCSYDDINFPLISPYNLHYILLENKNIEDYTGHHIKNYDVVFPFRYNDKLYDLILDCRDLQLYISEK